MKKAYSQTLDDLSDMDRLTFDLEELGFEYPDEIIDDTSYYEFAKHFIWDKYKLWCEITLWDGYFCYLIKEDRGNGVWCVKKETKTGIQYDPILALKECLSNVCKILIDGKRKNN